MAMTNLHYNTPPDIHSTHPLPPPPVPKHYTNYPTTNLSNLSPIYEGEIFASPTNTISPSISHNTIDNNHVALFNGHGHIKSNNISDKHSTNDQSISPTTSISSSNSSNTPTPTTYPTSNSLFNIPSTNNNPPCIPGLVNANISKTSTSSSSPSPSLDTTVSPVTKMDLFQNTLKVFEDTETNGNEVQIDYLTGDTYNTKNILHKKTKSKKKNKRKKHKKSKIKNGHSPYILPTNNNIESDNSSNSTPITPVINGSNVQYEPSVDFPNIFSHINGLKINYNIPPPPQQQPPHSPLNTNSIDHKHSKRTHSKHIKIKPRKHRHKNSKCKTKPKKRRKKSREYSAYSDSDSELQKKGKIKDKIKKISIRVPGDPNGLYKYWKRTTSHKSSHISPVKDCHLNIFSENKEDELNMKQLLNIDESFKLSMNPIAHTVNRPTRTRDRLNSYPPKNIIYSIKSPHILSSPSSSMSSSYTNSSNASIASMPNINVKTIKHIPIKLKKSQSCSNLLSNSIIIHTPTKNNKENMNENNNGNDTYNFSVLGLKNYTQNIGAHCGSTTVDTASNSDSQKHKNYNGYNIMKDYTLNRIRINSFPPYSELTDIVIEHGTPPIDDIKDEEWHYTSKKKKNKMKQNRNKYYNCHSSAAYYYTNKEIPIYKWNENDNEIESLSEPTNRKHKNINKKYNIHPSMNGKLYDL